LAHHFYTSYLLHFGHGKEHYYLNNIYQNEYSWEKKFKENFLSEKFFTFKEHHEFKSFKPYYEERTLENYKNYFLEISEYYVTQKKMFHGVADFSVSYQNLSLDDIKHFRDYITQYFDVKIIKMVRDPVRRLYSYCNMVYGKEKAKKYFYNLLTDPNEYSFYSKTYQNFLSSWDANIWGVNQSCVIAYEDIFGDLGDIAKYLHEFIGVPYLPIDKQTILIKSEYQEELTSEDIEFARIKLRQEYAYFHRTQKVLPSTWEYAKDWNYESLDFKNIQSNRSINPVDFY
jgi:hypothetical protein